MKKKQVIYLLLWLGRKTSNKKKCGKNNAEIGHQFQARFSAFGKIAR